MELGNLGIFSIIKGGPGSGSWEGPGDPRFAWTEGAGDRGVIYNAGSIPSDKLKQWLDAADKWDGERKYIAETALGLSYHGNTGIIEKDGDLKGVISFNNLGNSIYVNDIATKETGKDYGVALIQHAINEAAKQGVSLRLYSLPNAYMFYKKIGFTSDVPFTRGEEMTLSAEKCKSLSEMRKSLKDIKGLGKLEPEDGCFCSSKKNPVQKGGPGSGIHGHTTPKNEVIKPQMVSNYYHGTFSKIMDKIVREGIQPQKRHNWDTFYNKERKDSVFITHSLKDAVSYAKYTAEGTKYIPVVFMVNLKKSDLKVDEEDSKNFRKEGGIPPNKISSYSIDGGKTWNRVKKEGVEVYYIPIIVVESVEEKGGPGSGSWNGPGDPRFEREEKQEFEKAVEHISSFAYTIQDVNFENPKRFEEAVKSVATVHEDLVSRFPTLAELPPLNKIALIDDESLHSHGWELGIYIDIPVGAGGCYMQDVDGTTSINVSHGDKETEWTKSENAMWGEMCTVKTSAGIFAHEFGHHVFNNLMQDRFEALRFITEWERVATQSSFQTLGKKISIYAMSSPEECFSEAFARYTSKNYGEPNVELLPKQIERFFDKYVGSKRPGKVIGITSIIKGGPGSGSWEGPGDPRFERDSTGEKVVAGKDRQIDISDFPKDAKDISSEQRMSQAAFSDIKATMDKDLKEISSGTAQHTKVEGDLTKENATKIIDNAKSELSQYSNYLAGDTISSARDYIDHMRDVINNPELSKIDAKVLNELMTDSIRKMVYQEVESNRQQFTDHGIRHIVGDTLRQDALMKEFSDGKYSAMDRLMGAFIMINHDVGYTTPLIREGGLRGAMVSGDHKLFSEKILAEQKSTWNEGKLFSASQYDKILDVVKDHDTTKIDMGNLLKTTTALSDNLSLFSSEKLPGMFKYVEGGSSYLAKLGIAAAKKDTESFDRVKIDLHKSIDRANINEGLKRDLKAATKEISYMTPKFTLGVLAGSIDSISKDSSGKLNVDIKYNAWDSFLQRTFDMGQKQTEKLLKEYGHTDFSKTSYELGDVVKLNVKGYERDPSKKEFDNVETKGGEGSGSWNGPGDPRFERDKEETEKVARTEAETNLKNYMTMVKEMNSSGGRISDWKYKGMEDAVLTLGGFSKPQPLPKEYKYGKEKECFANAARLANLHRDLTYNEGFATTMGIPLQHAWCTDKDNNVIDNTWKPSAFVGEPAYYGVKFNTDYLWDVLGKKGTYGIFPEFGSEKYNPLRDGFPKGAIVPAGKKNKTLGILTILKGGEGSGSWDGPGDPRFERNESTEELHGGIKLVNLPDKIKEDVIAAHSKISSRALKDSEAKEVVYHDKVRTESGPLGKINVGGEFKGNTINLYQIQEGKVAQTYLHEFGHSLEKATMVGFKKYCNANDSQPRTAYGGGESSDWSEHLASAFTSYLSGWPRGASGYFVERYGKISKKDVLVSTIIKAKPKANPTHKQQWEEYFLKITAKKEKEFSEKLKKELFAKQKAEVLSKINKHPKPVEKGGPGSGIHGHTTPKDESSVVTMYHGTIFENVRSIIREGIKRDVERVYSKDLYKGGRKEKTFVTGSFEDADYWAFTLLEELGKSEDSSPEYRKCVLEVKIPSEFSDKLSRDKHGSKGAKDMMFDGDIKPEWIASAKVQTSSSGDWFELKRKSISKDMVMFMPFVLLLKPEEKRIGSNVIKGGEGSGSWEGPGDPRFEREEKPGGSKFSDKVSIKDGIRSKELKTEIDRLSNTYPKSILHDLIEENPLFVSVVPKLQGSRYGEAAFADGSIKIKISEECFSHEKGEPSMASYILSHEIGHYIEMTCSEAHEKKIESLFKKEAEGSKYTKETKVNYREFFAESFARYTSDNKRAVDSVPKGMLDFLGKEILRSGKQKHLGISTLIKVQKAKFDFSDWMFDDEEWTEMLAEMGGEFIKEMYDLMGTAVYEGLKYQVETAGGKLEGRFDVEDKDVIDFIKAKSYMFAEDVNATTADMIQSVMVTGMEDGLSMDQISDMIGKVFDGCEEWRADVIARTETIRASNYGAMEGYKQSGVVKEKEWLCTQDDRTCDACLAMDGTRIELDSNFFDKGDEMTVGEGEDSETTVMDYEDVGGPPLHPNCRCTLVPVVDESIFTPEELAMMPEQDHMVGILTKLLAFKGGPGSGSWEGPGDPRFSRDSELFEKPVSGVFRSGKDEAEKLGLSKERLDSLSELKGMRCDYTVKKGGKGQDGIVVENNFRDIKTGEDVGAFIVSIASKGDDANSIFVDYIHIDDSSQAKGIGSEIINKVESLAKEMRRTQIDLFADVSVGKYCWAVKGFDFAMKGQLQDSKTSLKSYTMNLAKAAGIKLDKTILSAEINKIKTAKDMSEFKIPGLVFNKQQLKKLNEFACEGVKGKVDMHIGKIFMLDEGGISDWPGVKKL